MSANVTYTAHARIDLAGRLISADEPLASFHQRCGGELPGPLVTPALIELVRKSRKLGLRLARPIMAQDDRDQISAWVEVVPGDDGISIAIANWQARPLSENAAMADSAHRFAMARQMSELALRLGPQQEVLAVLQASDSLTPLADRMRAAPGKPWTDFISFKGNAHKQPLHWRLLDGAALEIEGSARQWNACLVPFGRHQPGSDGFELHLIAAQPVEPPVPAEVAPSRADGDISGNIGRGIGGDIAPVLRQPVSRIIANAETIRTQLAGPLAEEYSAYAKDIASAGEHLLSLIDDLTTLEAVENEEFAVTAEAIDMADLARRAAGILRVRAKERGIAIDAPKMAETVPATGEFRRVLQILLNILGNAIRYTPEGSEVWIRAEVEEGRARVTVADMGEGLDEAEQARVFAKFERLGRSGDGGSGLGLYISRRLAEAMGGTLTVESAKGQGARFTLELPADQLDGEGEGHGEGGA